MIASSPIIATKARPRDDHMEPVGKSADIDTHTRTAASLEAIAEQPRGDQLEL